MRAACLFAVLALAPAVAWAQPDAGAVGARIAASFDAAERLQGPLDGSWTLVNGAGRPLYAFQLVDSAGGDEPLEGVWRDLRRPPIPGDIEMIDSVTRKSGSLTLRFGAGPTATVRLRQGAGGVWSGVLRDGSGVIAVKLRRG